MGTQTFHIEYSFDQAGQVKSVDRVGDNYDTWDVVQRSDDNMIEKELLGSGFTTEHKFHPTRRYVESIKSTHPTVSSVVDSDTPTTRPGSSRGGSIRLPIRKRRSSTPMTMR
jgi:endonuclease YncB( thermonuclease family)